jgi:RimJ/RimL family protein N-acetyltransferase
MSGTAPDRDRVRHTERLRLEPIAARHADELCALHADENVAHWYGSWPASRARDYAVAFEHDWHTSGIGKWMAYDRVTGALVGRGGPSRIAVDGAVRVEVGWVLRDAFRGHGYATEIGREALAFAFDEYGADEVVAFTEPHNERSRAVMVRLGMTYSRDILHDGERFVLYRIGATDPRR